MKYELYFIRIECVINYDNINIKTVTKLRTAYEFKVLTLNKNNILNRTGVAKHH